MKTKNLLTISYSDFSLSLIKNGEKFDFPISAAKNGQGEKKGSECTPRGMFEIHKKIGKNAESGTVFVSRKPTGEIWTEGVIWRENAILSRILWLSGKESHNANTKERYIYIHGTDKEKLVGKEHFSHGCIVMRNSEIIKLFDKARTGDYVFIY